MTHYVKLTQEQRGNLRKAVTGAPGWNAYRRERGITSADLQKEGLQDAARALGINPADYATPYVPKPRTVDYNAFVAAVIDPIFERMAPRDQAFIRIIAEDAGLHAGMITDGQADALRRIAARYADDKPAPAPTPAPEARTVDYNDLAVETGIIMIWDRLSDFDAGTIRAIRQDSESHGGLVTNDQAVLIRQIAASVRDDKPSPARPAPAPTPVSDTADAAAKIAEILAGVAGTAKLDESRVIELIKTHGGSPAHVTIDLRTPAMPEGVPGERVMHYREPLLLAAVNANVPVMLVGPAGSGKTTAARNVADALGLPFYFTGAIDSPYKLLGFIDAQGRVVRTPFREAFEHGGVFLFDEQDASLPGAVLAFNAATANGLCDFPDRTVKAHPNFRVIAACNTFGRGADRQYVGRLQQDAAALDRYAVLTWDYDPALESALIGLPRPEGAPVPASVSPVHDDAIRTLAARWIERVRAVRAKVELNKIRHVVSPRATILGTRLLAAGWPWADAEEAVIFKGVDSDARAKIQ